MTMASRLTDWPRQHYAPGGKDPFLFYAVFGRVDTTMIFSRSKYRSDGPPEGISVMTYGPTSNVEVVASFRDGYSWDRLTDAAPTLAANVTAQDSCLVLKGEVSDPPTLNYLRDVIGLLTFFLDAGGVAIYDPQVLTWWAPSDWRRRIFDVGSSAPRHHVAVLLSGDADGTQWIHTRGMRKFGRPDLSVRKVRPEHKKATIDLCNRFIEFLAFGGVIEDGQVIRVKSLPSGMRCLHRGNDDDPDFNNDHIEIVWPGSAEHKD
jgi:hypothetical protein